MPNAWTNYVDTMGVGILAHRIQDEPVRLTRVAVGGTCEEETGDPGDYIVKGHDGYLRIAVAAEFEARFQPTQPPSIASGVIAVGTAGAESANNGSAMPAAPDFAVAAIEPAGGP